MTSPYNSEIAKQGELFIDLSRKKVRIRGNYYPSHINQEPFQLHSRRYIGNKRKLIDWIFPIILKKCPGNSFADIFAGTGSVAAEASHNFHHIILNDFLYSNNVIYKAFFGKGDYNYSKIAGLINDYNNLSPAILKSNYFSDSFGNKYFSHGSAQLIGFIREDIEKRKDKLNPKEYNILLASLLYSVDKIANTVGHYDAYFKKNTVEDKFIMKTIKSIDVDDVAIYREDANSIVKKIEADVVYIDPPYNSRQYSRFYHILENITTWEKPELHGVALKPKSENMSDYCRVSAFSKFQQLINDIKAKYIVVSYNNTYESKSNSSCNKIELPQIKEILVGKGEVSVFEKSYRHFNAGNTKFNDHKEYLFVTRVKK